MRNRTKALNLLSMGVPCGSGYPLYLFYTLKAKKDAAAIPYATVEQLFKRISFRIIHFRHIVTNSRNVNV